MKTGKKLYLSQGAGNIPDDKPMVFWDTCALLDIVRIPVRKNLGINDLECYERIADCIEREEVVSITSGLVVREFTDHYEEEHGKLLHAQTSLKNVVGDYADYMESITKKERIKKGVALLNVEHRLVCVLSRILRHTFVLREEAVYNRFADYRVRHKMAPAAHKQEYKDCYIWGTFLELIHKLEPVSSYIAFMTTNKEDYQKGNDLFPQLVADCYKPSMHVVLHIGQLRGGIDAALNPPQI